MLCKSELQIKLKKTSWTHLIMHAQVLTYACSSDKTVLRMFLLQHGNLRTYYVILQIKEMTHASDYAQISSKRWCLHRSPWELLLARLKLVWNVALKSRLMVQRRLELQREVWRRKWLVRFESEVKCVKSRDQVTAPPHVVAVKLSWMMIFLWTLGAHTAGVAASLCFVFSFVKLSLHYKFQYDLPK